MCAVVVFIRINIDWWQYCDYKLCIVYSEWTRCKLGALTLLWLVFSSNWEERTSCVLVQTDILKDWVDCRGVSTVPCLRATVHLTDSNQSAVLHFDEESVLIAPEVEICGTEFHILHLTFTWQCEVRPNASVPTLTCRNILFRASFCSPLLRDQTFYFSHISRDLIKHLGNRWRQKSVLK